jgi:sialic acid synthase SpsE
LTGDEPTDRIMIGTREVGPDRPCYLIAEAGSNHNGSLRMALELIDVAASTGCDAVKFQVFRADDLVVADSPKADYLGESLGARSIYEHFQDAAMDRTWLPELAAACRARGIDFLATPFDVDAVDALVAADVDAPAIKIASSELWHTPLLQHAARTGRPIILSTGMATLADVHEAVDTIHAAAPDTPVCLLHCTVKYPAPAETVNLRAMATMRADLGLPVGLSDHTRGTWAAVAAVSLGAVVVEKHFTLSRTLPGPDHVFALEPAELERLAADVRSTESAMGDGSKVRQPEEEEIYVIGRRNLVAARDLPAGHRVAAGDLLTLRSPLGIEPGAEPKVVGRELVTAVRAGAPLQWADLGLDDGG